MLKLRYVKQGAVLYPQYFKDGEWKYINSRHVECSRALEGITWDLGCRDTHSRNYPWSKSGDIGFNHEIYINAFLGAFKFYYTTRTEEFTL